MANGCAARSEGLSVGHPVRPAALWRVGARVRHHCRPHGVAGCQRACHPVGLHPAEPPLAIRSAQPPDLGVLAHAAASHQRLVARRRCGGHRDRQQVRGAASGQAPVQPYQSRARHPLAADRPRLGLSRPVGQPRLVRLSDGLPRRPRRHASRARGRHAGVPRDVRRSSDRPRGVAWRSDRDSAAPARERRAAAVRVLHDLGSENHARFANRPAAFRRARRGRRVLRAVPPVPHQRPALVTRALLVRRSDP